MPTNPAVLRAVNDELLAQPDEKARANVIYDVTRQCYDTIKRLSQGLDTPERFSAGEVSDAALAHQSRMHGWGE